MSQINGLVLPTTKIPAVSTNPQYLILYGLPKSGNKQIF